MRAPPTSAEARLTVTPTTAFPEYCCSCTAPTRELERVEGRTHGADPLWVRILAGVGLAMFAPKALLRGPAELRGERTVFTVEIPRCATCRRSGPLLPLHVNLERREMLLQVRRAFADRVHG